MLEVKPTVSVATRPPEVAKTAGAYRFVAIWAIPFNQLLFCHLVRHSEVFTAAWVRYCTTNCIG